MDTTTFLKSMSNPSSFALCLIFDCGHLGELPLILCFESVFGIVYGLIIQIRGGQPAVHMPQVARAVFLCGMQQIGKEKGSAGAHMAGSRHRSIGQGADRRLGREHGAGSRKQIRQGKRFGATGECAKLTCGTSAQKVVPR